MIVVIKKIFVDALNASDIHNTNFNFCLPEGDGSSETGKLILSQNRRSFPLNTTVLRVNRHIKIMTLNHKKI